MGACPTLANTTNSTRRLPYEAADILARYLDDYLANYKVSSWQRRVLWDSEHCRTAAFGGHVKDCDRCGYLEIAYNS